MKVVILCGGQGTRIRGVADDMPKPMLPIGGYPILWHIMKYYACFGSKEFILCLGYKGNVIKDFFINYKNFTSDFTIRLGRDHDIKYHNSNANEDWSVTLADTGLNSLTGARVKKIKKYVEKDETFMLTYGDGVGDVDIKKLVEFHKSSGKIMTVTGVKPPGRFGELVRDAKGNAIEFNEKPQATAGLISGGFFVCSNKLFDYLDDREDLVFEQDPMRNILKENQMMVYEHSGFWQPMDTYREYSLLNSLYKKGDAPWVKW